MRGASRGTSRAIASFNQLIGAMRQPLESYDQVCLEMNSLIARVDKTGSFQPGDRNLLDGLITRVRSDLEQLDKAPKTDPELLPMLDAFVSCERGLREALKLIRQIHDHPDSKRPEGPNGVARQIEESNRDMMRVLQLREAYIKSHGLVTLGDQPPGQNPPALTTHHDSARTRP
jgi:hypothetical protein